MPAPSARCGGPSTWPRPRATAAPSSRAGRRCGSCWPITCTGTAPTTRWPARCWSGSRRPSPPAGPAGAAAAPAALVVPLSEREQVVLRYLSSRLSAGEIADELYVSLNTVKTHIKSIYRKLDTNRRWDAVKRARQLQLL